MKILLWIVKSVDNQSYNNRGPLECCFTVRHSTDHKSRRKDWGRRLNLMKGGFTSSVIVFEGRERLGKTA